MRWLERVLFGREGVARAEAARRRLQAAIERRERPDRDLEAARQHLQEAVEECASRARMLTSDPPPVIRFIVADPDQVVTQEEEADRE